MVKDMHKNNFTVFFSLPFYRKTKKNFFFHGHLSIGLGKYVFQVYNPKLLHSDFFISKMPIKNWLFDDGIFFDGRKNSTTFRHVHLYRKAETKKTIVYYARIDLSESTVKEFQNYFEGQEKKYQEGKINFNIFYYNCATIINSVFYSEKWLKKEPLDFIPSITFKRIVKAWKKQNVQFSTGKISGNMVEPFRLHKFCIGIFGLNPECALDKYLATTQFSTIINSKHCLEC